VFKSGEGAGGSGSFFFFSHDKNFIIKTMTDVELKLFLEILPDYERHLKENPTSLIARIYGCYTINMKDIANIHVMLMANTLNFKNSANI
jgi:1-phosphatidylinositol-4-phosphate 5-kinase